MNLADLSASCTFCPALRKIPKAWQRGMLGWAFLALFIASSAPSHGMGPRRFHAGETQTGLASWYGSEQGRHTASGEVLDRHALTAAHRYLPFNTIIRVTNQENGKTVELRINDRGPYRGGRILDVSEAAANILDMKRAGTVPVLIEVMELGMPRPHHHG